MGLHNSVAHIYVNVKANVCMAFIKEGDVYYDAQDRLRYVCRDFRMHLVSYVMTFI